MIEVVFDRFGTRYRLQVDDLDCAEFVGAVLLEFGECAMWSVEVDGVATEGDVPELRYTRD